MESLPLTKQSLLNDPRRCAYTHLLAHEATKKEIDECFQQLPWCVYLVLWDGKVICRDSWELGVW